MQRRRHGLVFALSAPLFAVVGACGSSGGPAASTAVDAGGSDAAPLDASSASEAGDPAALPHPVPVDGGYAAPDGGSIRADRFITKVVSVTYGPCAGFGQKRMPDVVYGPPMGGGDTEGSLDVVSLGNGGEIVVSFEPNAIVDGPGPDLLVFENPFFVAGNPNDVAAEPGEVSVSDDGVTWKTYPCTATSAPYGACAGWHPVYSNPDNGISPIDPAVAGGDAFDLADVGLTRARYVRVRDKTNEPCPTGPGAPTTNGFDLDAMAIVNAQTP